MAMSLMLFSANAQIGNLKDKLTKEKKGGSKEMTAGNQYDQANNVLQKTSLKNYKATSTKCDDPKYYKSSSNKSVTDIDKSNGLIQSFKIGNFFYEAIGTGEDENGNVVESPPVEIFLYTQSSSLANGPVVINHGSDLRKLCFWSTFLPARIVSISFPILLSFSSDSAYMVI